MTTEQRLERLERQNQWMRRLGAVGVALVATVFLMGQAEDKTAVLEAQRFVLKDGKGRVRAELGTQEDGWVGLSLMDIRGKRRTFMACWDRGNGFGAFGKDGDTNLLLVQSEAGNPSLVFNDGKNDLPGLSLAAARDGWVELDMWGKKRRPRAQILLKPDGSQSVHLENKDGKVIWQAPKD